MTLDPLLSWQALPRSPTSASTSIVRIASLNGLRRLSTESGMILFKFTRYMALSMANPFGLRITTGRDLPAFA